MNPSCRLCAAATVPYGSQRILHQFEVQYHLCPRCDLIQTETPYWLEQAYSSAISALDTGAVARNVFCARLTAVLGRLLHIRPPTPCLDYGGGHGVFVRMMRDVGWNFAWADKYGPNIFARGFEGKMNLPHRLVTAFEVFEHLVNVREELTALFAPGHDFVLVSTLLHNRPPADWWYFVPETGQHVALYSRKTMAMIGTTFGYEAICGKAYTLFVKNGVPLSSWRRALVRRVLNWSWLAYGLGTLLVEARLHKSLSWTDHLALKAATKMK